MSESQDPVAPPKLVARLAVVGMALAVIALGALAVRAAMVTGDGARVLSGAGVQTSGHLRAVQALSLLDTHTDALESGVTESRLRRLNQVQRMLQAAVGQMETGGVPQASQIAREAGPLIDRLDPAIDQFVSGRAAAGKIDGAAEEEMDDIIAELQQVLNRSDFDPSALLTSQLEEVTASERTIRRMAVVLVPLGLGGVVACGWVLSVYRRRSEATIRTALDMTSHEARTDQLTGLPNRRALLEAFERRSGRGEGFVLALADLNGFKRYNDTFGHPAGDALLRRLGRKLNAACAEHGIAARLGGDEFCVLFPAATPADEVQSLLHEALTEEGEGFRITAASGTAAVPEEAHDSSAALRLADGRMYAAKVSAQPLTDHGISVALTRMLDERHPGLGSHGHDVSTLTVACAERLGLPGDEIRLVERAAELHDLGKIGIPTAILTKPGPLSEEEWEFMRRHSIIGERILAGIPSMEHIAPLIRSAHERWNGSGYPDGLVGERIPLGARIMAVADAFCAMTEARPYAQARSVNDALWELKACSGTQFDPTVVAAFLSVLENAEARAALATHLAIAH